MSDPTLTVLGSVDVTRKRRREMRDAVDERVAEQDGETQEDQECDERDNGHRSPATLHAPVLQRDDDRIEDQRDEAADQAQQQEVAQVIDQLAREVHRGHGEDREENREDRYRVDVSDAKNSSATRFGDLFFLRLLHGRRATGRSSYGHVAGGWSRALSCARGAFTSALEPPKIISSC